MKLPRDISADDFIKALSTLGYFVVRQTGSHIRLSHRSENAWKLTVPNHDPIRIGTLSSILDDVARQQLMTRTALLAQLDL